MATAADPDQKMLCINACALFNKWIGFLICRESYNPQVLKCHRYVTNLKK
jgi:hypothetical protein